MMIHRYDVVVKFIITPLSGGSVLFGVKHFIYCVMSNIDIYLIFYKKKIG